MAMYRALYAATSALAVLACLAAAVATEGPHVPEVAPVITIPLDKQYVPVIRNGATVAHKTAYFGKVFLGQPSTQAFTVVFDTGSGHFFLPSASCRSETCAKHRRYDRAASASAVDINHDGSVVEAGDSERDEVSVVYGTGEITGGFVRETVCLHNSTARGISAPAAAPSGGDCATVRLVLAHDMTEEPFGSFRFDGVVGLGLNALSLDPEFSFFGQMAKMGGLAEARFGYFLSRSDLVPSEIAFGGHDARRVASELQWAPVHRPELGYWQVKIRRITVGGQVLKDCEDGGCSAIADTGTSLLGVPKQAMKGLHVQLARKVPGDPDQLDCRDFAGPELVFELADGVRLTLGPEDYSRAAAMRVLQSSTNRAQVICRASLMSVESDPILGGKAWILGEPVLRKYYTVYDWERQQVGFALARSPEAPALAQREDAAGGHTVTGAAPGQALTPAVVHI